jgi:DNA-binding transcriptional LysR family regulator
MLFDLTDLRLFTCIAELNSVGSSAQCMSLSHNAANERLRDLEGRCGVPLLYRENDDIQLTPAGHTFLTHAQQFLRQFEHLKADMQQYHNNAKGHICIFANTTAVTEFMPGILGKFMALHPHVNVVLEEHLNHDIMRGVQESRADIGIVAGPVKGEGVEVVSFSTDRLVLATALEHPLAGVPQVRFAETLEYEHVGLHEGSTLHDFINRVVADNDQHLKLRIQVRSFESMCRMVESNVGIGILPQSAALRHKQTMQLSLTALSDPWCVRERSLVVKNMDDMPLYARDLIDFIRQETAHSIPALKEAA